MIGPDKGGGATGHGSTEKRVLECLDGTAEAIEADEQREKITAREDCQGCRTQGFEMADEGEATRLLASQTETSSDRATTHEARMEIWASHHPGRQGSRLLDRHPPKHPPDHPVPPRKIHTLLCLTLRPPASFFTAQILFSRLSPHAVAPYTNSTFTVHHWSRAKVDPSLNGSSTSPGHPTCLSTTWQTLISACSTR